MTREELTQLISQQMPDFTLGTDQKILELIIKEDNLHLLARYLKVNPTLKMDYLFCLTAADRKDGLHVLYFLTSSLHGHSIKLRVVLEDKESPQIPTVCDIWKAAEFYEREVYDLFGIRFENHPDLRRIFLDESWVGYPLRKDYKDEFILDR